MIVGYVQNAPQFGEKEANFKQVSPMALNLKADLLVLPELFATGYAFTSEEEARSMAESVEGPTASFLMELSDLTDAVIVAGLIEEEHGRIYNSSIMVYGHRVIGTYRKIHLFNKEKLWFSPGDKPLNVYQVKGISIGMMICFDWFFPETARTLAIRGAQIIAHPSNLVMPYCQNSMVTRCLENRIFAITANRIGREARGEDDFTFTGRSQITGFDGSILATAPLDEISLRTVEIDIHDADNKLINPYNDLIGDRRTDFYL